MIHLTFQVENISTVLLVYNQIQVQKSSTETGTFTTVSGGDFPIALVSGQTVYSVDDPSGVSTDWYRSRCYNTLLETASGWASPVLGSVGDLMYDPTYPAEIIYGTSDQLIIDRIRTLCGDSIGLRREYNEYVNVHGDNKVYEIDERGWPCVINVGGVVYTATSNPTVNGYRYLQFNDDITTLSGVELDIDIYFYTFRHSDREIMEAYDNCPAPQGLTVATANAESYMLQTTIDLLSQELWQDATEDGASIKDDSSTYDPDGGQKIRTGLIDKFQKRLDKLVRSLLMGNITGVRVD